MVLSPIEPVAPSTVMLRTASAVALLFRNGTALILSPHRSPNHKTAADAVEAAPHQAQNRREHNGGDIAVEAIEQPAMPGNDVAGILDAEMPFHGGFKEVAELRDDRQRGTNEHDWYNIACAGRGPGCGYREAADKAADGARPGLVRAHPWRELR